MEEESSFNEFLQDKNEVMVFEVHLQSIFKEIASGVSLETFKQIFGDIVKNRSSLLERLHSVFVQELYNGIMDEVQLKEFVVEENLEEKFRKRAKLIKENADGEVAWRPTTGDVDQQLRSHDMAAMLKYKTELEEFVLAKEACVEHLRAKTASLRLKMHKLDADIAASRRLRQENVAGAQRLRDSMLSAWLENTQNVRAQAREQC